MKNTKLSLLISVILSTSSIAMAASPEGAPDSHRMTCGPILDAEGNVEMRAGLILDCQTQALAPQFSVRGCELSSDSGTESLQQISQDGNTAVYAYATGGKIVLNKQNFTATLTLADGSSGDCQ
jgi:hypothetical protein